MCQACGKRPQIQGNPVVECHHKDPLSNGTRETKLSDLVTLCPTCHRAVHTREPAYSLKDLKKLLKLA
ncbi:HNH endonuclease [Kordiimonas lacus]